MFVHLLFRRRTGAYSMERVFAPLQEEFHRLGWDCHSWQVPRESRSFWQAFLNIVWCRRLPPALVHVTGDVNYCILGLKSRNSILTMHDFGYLQALTGWKRWLVKKLWIDWPTRRCCVVTCVSETTRQELLRLTKVAPDKLVVIHNPLHPQFVAKPREQFGSPPRILHFNFTSNKNLSRSIVALRGIPCHLRIIGALTEAQKQQLQHHELDYSWAADISDAQMVAEYEQCDLLCFPSTYEGFGLPVIEAQATGRPVLTAKIAPLTEVGGDAACYVEPLSSESIRAGLTRIINDADYRQHLVIAGQANVKRFQLAVIAQQYIELYARLVKDESG